MSTTVSVVSVLSCVVVLLISSTFDGADLVSVFISVVSVLNCVVVLLISSTFDGADLVSVFVSVVSVLDCAVVLERVWSSSSSSSVSLMTSPSAPLIPTFLICSCRLVTNDEVEVDLSVSRTSFRSFLIMVSILASSTSCKTSLASLKRSTDKGSA